MEIYQVTNQNQEGINIPLKLDGETAKDYSINQQPTYQQKYIPVLMYHQIKDQIGITKEEISIGVSITLFEEQIKALLNAGYRPIHFKQLQAYLEGRLGLPNKPFIITTDDGYLDRNGLRHVV